MGWQSQSSWRRRRDGRRATRLWRTALTLKLALLSTTVLACGFPRPQDVSPGDGGEQPGDDAKTCVRTACVGDVLEVCGASGTVEHIESCELGCLPDESRCYDLVPSNGLGPFLDQSAQEEPILLPPDATIDTSTGAITSALGALIPVPTALKVQPGGVTLRVLIAKSWTIDDVRIHGDLPVAFVSRGEIELRGLLDASANGGISGPGGQACGSAAGGGGIPFAGFFGRPPLMNSGGYPAFLWVTNGFGGGGFGTAGGVGGLTNVGVAVGAPGQVNGNAELVPLRGGCEGGGDMPQYQGAGGGAIAFISSRAVRLTANDATSIGVVHVGGGGGVAGALGHNSNSDPAPIYGPGGGGAGGGILIEAPVVALDDRTMLLAGGGAGGGYGACLPAPDGRDAVPNETAALGGDCPAGTTPWSTGGAGAVTGSGESGESVASGSAGSGGGGLGRIRINTVDGLYSTRPGVVIRGVTTAGVLERR
jgi:hypothetical protein